MDPISTLEYSLERVRTGYVSSVKVTFTEDYLPKDGDVENSVTSGYLTFKRILNCTYTIIKCGNGKYVYLGPEKGFKQGCGDFSLWKTYTSSKDFKNAALEIISSYQNDIKNCWNIAELDEKNTKNVIYQK